MAPGARSSAIEESDKVCGKSWNFEWSLQHWNMDHSHKEMVTKEHDARGDDGLWSYRWENCQLVEVCLLKQSVVLCVETTCGQSLWVEFETVLPIERRCEI